MTGTPPETLLHGARIWDGEQQLDADALLVSGARIAAIGIGAELGARTSASVRRIDCRGATLLPGLIDAHVHMELDPNRSAPPAAEEPRDLARMGATAESMLRAGITTARDLGGGAWAELQLRDRIAAGALSGPRLLCAGQPITSPQGHCHFWGGEAPDLAGARAVIDRQVEHGVDLIKVMATGGVFTRGSSPAGAQFDQATLDGIVTAAARHGLGVAAHCHGTEGIERAARAGVRSIEHCSWVGPQGWAANYEEQVARIILERGVWVSPTVNRGWRRYLEPGREQALERIRGAYKAMLAMGIQFIASTDAGIPGVFHHHLPEALAVFCAIAELSAADTLRTATANAADALGLGAVTGRLRQGLAADLLLVDGDPLQDLSALTRPVGVWARGRAALEP
ncbi:MAG: amidohydrolase family protein [Pseudomonadales bacterium]